MSYQTEEVGLWSSWWCRVSYYSKIVKAEQDNNTSEWLDIFCLLSTHFARHYCTHIGILVYTCSYRNRTPAGLNKPIQRDPTKISPLVVRTRTGIFTAMIVHHLACCTTEAFHDTQGVVGLQYCCCLWQPSKQRTQPTGLLKV